MTINLIPIMNLFVALIPFLLLCAAFFHISVINASVPATAGDEETDVAKKEEKITVTLRITPAYFGISAASDTLTPDELAPLKGRVLRGDNEFDRLSAALYNLKSQYPKSDTIIIVPDREVIYEDLIHAMDAAREYRTEREGEKLRLTMLPRVVVSSLVQ